MDSDAVEPRQLSMRALMLVVFAAVAAIGLLASVAPSPFRIPLMILAPASIMAASLPFMISRWVAQPLRNDLTHANERVAHARRELHDERTSRSALRELDRGLDQAGSEGEAVSLIRQALIRQQLDRACELHLVDPVDPVMTLSVATSEDALPGERISPWDSLAARTGTTLIYSSTDRLDACTHLTSRILVPRAAVAVPLNATGRLLGVLYVFDREGTEFTPDDVTELEDLASIAAGRVAILRASAPSKNPDALDRLTGLPDRSAMQERVIRLLEARQPFTLAVADIDHFGALNASHGREAGDRALQMVARVSRRAMRPDDLVGRIGGDELLFVLPRTSADDTTRALERLREELVLAQSVSDDPTITLSIGVIGSTTGGTIEALLHRAAGALNHAKSQGGNRVVVAQPAPKV